MSILGAIHNAFNKLPGVKPKEVAMAEIAKKPNEKEEEVKEEVAGEVTENETESPDSPDSQEAPKEEPKEEAKEEVKEEIVEEKVEDKVEEKPAALKESDAVSKLMAQQELLLKQNEELQAKIESLSKEKALVSFENQNK